MVRRGVRLTRSWRTLFRKNDSADLERHRPVKLPPENGGSRFIFGVAGLAALGGAVVLLLFATFPYWYAESGSAAYAREHQGQAILMTIGATALLWVAWQFLRRTMGWKPWLAVVTVVVVIAVAKSYDSSIKVPPGIRPVGGPFYVSSQRGPVEADDPMYTIYYKNGRRYWSIESQVVDFKFVAPDCMYYHELHVLGYPAAAMCGFRIPVTTSDTSVTDTQILASAKRQERYRADWRYRR